MLNDDLWILIIKELEWYDCIQLQQVNINLYHLTNKIHGKKIKFWKQFHEKYNHYPREVATMEQQIIPYVDRLRFIEELMIDKRIGIFLDYYYFIPNFDFMAKFKREHILSLMKNAILEYDFQKFVKAPNLRAMFHVEEIYDRLWTCLYKNLLRYPSMIPFILKTKYQDPKIFLQDYKWFVEKYKL